MIIGQFVPGGSCGPGRMAQGSISTDRIFSSKRKRLYWFQAEDGGENNKGLMSYDPETGLKEMVAGCGAAGDLDGPCEVWHGATWHYQEAGIGLDDEKGVIYVLSSSKIKAISLEDGSLRTVGRVQALCVGSDGNVYCAGNEGVFKVPLAPDAGEKTTGQYKPVAAFGKDGYLVVWRAGLENRGAKLLAARLDKTGRTLDPKGIALAGDLLFQHEAAVAFGGGLFLVVFSAIKAQKGADGLLQSGVFGVRVSVEGKVLDEKPFPIGDAPGQQAQPDVAFDGTNFRVAWVALLDADTKLNDFWGLPVKGCWKFAPRGFQRPASFSKPDQEGWLRVVRTVPHGKDSEPTTIQRSPVPQGMS